MNYRGGMTAPLCPLYGRTVLSRFFFEPAKKDEYDTRE